MMPRPKHDAIKSCPVHLLLSIVRYHKIYTTYIGVQKKDKYRREGKGRRCCLGDRNVSIPCRVLCKIAKARKGITSFLSPQQERRPLFLFCIYPSSTVCSVLRAQNLWVSATTSTYYKMNSLIHEESIGQLSYGDASHDCHILGQTCHPTFGYA